MYISAVRLYHPAPWGWLYSYQALLITLRMLELISTTILYMFVKAPLLVMWTRLPGLRHRRPPLWRNLALVLAPTETRASLSIGGRQLGSDLAYAGNLSEVEGLVTGFLSEVEPPSRFWNFPRRSR